MGVIRDAANTAFADGPVSAPSQPPKPQIRALFGTVEDQMTAAAAGQVSAPTWADLASILGTRDGQPAIVPNTDTGTHTDPVVGGTVTNGGNYAWSVSPAGWQWISAVVDVVQETDADDLLQIIDPSGFVAFRVSEDAIATAAGFQVGSEIIEYVDGTEIELMIADPNGFLIFSSLEGSSSSNSDQDDAFAPVTPDFLIPPALWFTEGRDLPLYPQGMLSTRTEGQSVYAAVSAVPTAPEDPPYVHQGSQEIILDTSRLSGSFEMAAWRLSETPGTIYRRDISIGVAPASATASPVLLCIGDSLMNRRIPWFVNAKLTDRGMTPTFVGTINGQTPTGENGPLGEAREGKEYGDYIGWYVDDMVPVDAGDEAAYLALSKTNKVNRNPMVRPATGGDASSGPDQIAYNGWVFDVGDYLTRFSLATPTHVVIELMTNDISLRDVATAEAQIQAGLRVMAKQTRAALPDAKIAFLLHTIGRYAGDSRWARHHTAIGDHIKFVTDLGDDGITILPAYMHEHVHLSWTYTDVSTNDQGITTSNLSEGIHFQDLNRSIAAELIASWVGATI